MPEGDTLYRAAVTLRKALLGKTVTRFESDVNPVNFLMARRPVVGRTVSAVEARGKNLLIVLRQSPEAAAPDSDSEDEQASAADPIPTSETLKLDLIRSDLVLYTHLRMTGSWHIYRPGEAWRKPERYAKVTLYTDDFVAPCFSAPVVELMTAREASRHPFLNALGSDAMIPEFDPLDVRAKMRRHLDVPIGVVIMNQRVMAGVGNEFKSEIFFILRLNPFLPVRDFSDETLDALIAKSHELLRLNTNRGHRRTMFHLNDKQRVWAYGRSGQPCYACGTLLKMRRQGLDGRSTYYCPQCQGGPYPPA